MITRKKQELIAKIDEMIAASKEDLAEATKKLVNIKSVKGEALPGAPFGKGPKQVLDAVLDMGQKEGFYTVDHQVGVVCIAFKEGQPDLGIWTHGDVVPEGDGWNYEPYDAVEYKGCIIGRGATDNKGQLAAMFHLFKIFKTLDIHLNYNPAIYVGSNEESGMKDMIGIPGNLDARGFLHVCTPPRLSLVPDSGFPVGYGGNGSLKLLLKSKAPLHGFVLTAGQDDSPAGAEADFGDFKVITKSTPSHGARPDSKGNMITKIAQRLLDQNLVDELDRGILEFLRDVSLDTAGSMFGIDVKKLAESKPLTVSAKKINTVDGYVEFLLDIRYPVTITSEIIMEQIAKVCEEGGFVINEKISDIKPYLLDSGSEIIKILMEIANDVTGDDAVPYTLRGATYAHCLPNAYVYGTDGNLPPEDFSAGRGKAHGVDEAVSLDRLQRAMKIYARALLTLNEMNW